MKREESEVIATHDIGTVVENTGVYQLLSAGHKRTVDSEVGVDDLFD